MRLAERLLWDILTDAGEFRDGPLSNGDIRDAEGYAEPGYETETPDAPVILADWNGSRANPAADPLRVYQLHSIQSLADVRDIYRGRIAARDYRNRIARIGALAERLGWGVEWSDEWSECGECRRTVRTSGDSYSWTPSYAIVGGCELLCADCIREDPEEWEAELTNSDTSADTLEIDWHARGWRETRPPYENGWYPGQTDTPEEIHKRINFANVETLFVIDRVGQFDCAFSLWIRPLRSRHGEGADYSPPANRKRPRD